MTVRELRTEGERELAKVGSDSAANDALALLLSVLGTDLTGYAGRLGDRCSESETAAYRALIRRRAAHEPLQYITGEAPFFGRMFSVTEDVLIPRFDSETMAAEAVRALPEGGAVLDLCCGSGCLLLTVLAERPDAAGVGTDISEAALRVSKKNAERLGLAGRALFYQGDLFAALKQISEDAFIPVRDAAPAEAAGAPAFSKQSGPAFDIIISNPPYIPDAVIETLDPEVREHEPRLALSGGPDGLAFYRRIVPEAVHFLKEDGVLFLEVGSDEAEAVLQMLRDAGYRNAEILKDLTGSPRSVRGTCPAALQHPKGTRSCLTN